MMRRESKPIRIGPVTVGGGAPIVVQSMTKTDTRDAAATVRQLHALAGVGCELARLAVPDTEAAQALPRIKKESPLPLIADIHFDHRLALASLGAGVDGLRLNPGNIGAPERVAAVVRAARERAVPIRVGVNAGSLPQDARRGSVAERMVAAALAQVRQLEALDFDLIKVSLKAFDVPTTVAAYTGIAPLIPYPLHLGITESGLARAGTVRSAVGLGVLLFLGIGDTVRVSLTGPPEEEVAVAYEILKSLNLRQRGATLVSCPTCGRIETDLESLARAVEAHLQKIDKPLKVAVMGCVVNGPGEAADADVGIACGKGRGVLFRGGVKLRTVEEQDYLSALLAEIEKLAAP
ncbi:MAG: flavodoxin-dependent (E)-4-hydroxy-3-methylbut-2-enyl-diphosphate synthase [Chloroflexi bacterium]|nr:flavodoxin-dependent (E)-4-hydroxy-3-methylbut-2-enyl-diphosphate synthase [Chloroflexota bacterium]